MIELLLHTDAVFEVMSTASSCVGNNVIAVQEEGAAQFVMMEVYAGVVNQRQKTHSTEMCDRSSASGLSLNPLEEEKAECVRRCTTEFGDN